MMQLARKRRAKEAGAIVPLTEMIRGEQGTIARLDGGKGFQSNLRARGVREGKKVVVKEVQPWGGPVLINVEGEEVALGRGMAERIVVNVTEDVAEDREEEDLEVSTRERSASGWFGRGRGRGRGKKGRRRGGHHFLYR
jgi:ferrous iron transport protein A